MSVDTGALLEDKTGEVTVTLFPGLSYRIRKEWAEETEDAVILWRGSIPGYQGGRARFTVGPDGGVYGRITVNQKRYVITPTSTIPVHIVYELDQSRLDLSADLISQQEVDEAARQLEQLQQEN